MDWLKAGKISVPIKATFALNDIQAAHREYANSKGIGPIIIAVPSAAGGGHLP